MSFREAMSLNPGAGVKREIASLVSALKKAPLTSTASGDAEDEPSSSDTAATETPAAEKTTRTRKQTKTAAGTQKATRKTAAKKTTKTATK